MPRIAFTITPLSNVDMENRRILNLNRKHKVSFELDEEITVINLLCNGEDVQRIKAEELNIYDHLLVLGDTQTPRRYKVLSALPNEHLQRIQLYAHSFAR